MNFRYKRLAAVALALSLLSGCTLTERIGIPESSADSEADITPVSTVRTGYFGLAYYTGEAINPVLSTSKINRVLVEALYEGLFYLNNDFQAQKLLCEDWTGDGTTFTFTLKSGVTFWSGAALTADDVVYSLLAAKNNEESPYFARMTDVGKIIALDSSTVKVVLNIPNMDFPRLLDIPIFRKGTEGDPFSDGTGAYRPNTADGSWWLSPYESWHGGSAVSFERIDLVSTVRADAAVYSFETGDVSMTRATRISPTPATISGAVDLYQTPTTDLHYVGFNCAKEPYNLPAVRQAFSAAIDRRSVCNTQLQTFADPAVLPVNPQPEDQEIRLDSDRDTAVALFSQAGVTDSNQDGVQDYDNGRGKRVPLAPVILVNTENSFKVAAAQQLANTLALVGVQATVRAVPFDEYTQLLQKGQFDLYYAEVIMTPDFDLRALLCTGGALNYGGYSNFETDTQILYARAQGTPEAKNALYKQLLAEMPVLPIAFIRDQVAVRSGLINGFTPMPDWLFHGVSGWRKSSG